LAVSYFVVPLVLDSDYLNRSVWEPAFKYDSPGHSYVLKTLFTGDLLDFDRFPSLSFLLLAGLAVAIFRFRDQKHRALVALFLVWLLLYFGRATWGPLFNILPFTHDLPLHRFIGGVHLSAALLIGVGLAIAWEVAFAQRKLLWSLGLLVLAVLLLAPVYHDRAVYLAANGDLIADNNQFFRQEQENVDALISALKALPPGRVYSGLAGTWGADYRIGFVPMYGLYPVNGLDSLGYLYHAQSLNSDLQVHFNDTRLRDYDLFNVQYVVAPAERAMPDFLTRLAQYGRHVLYQAPSSGYFNLVDSDIALTSGKDDWYAANLQWLQIHLPDLNQHPSIFFGDARGDYRAVLSMAQADQARLTAAIPQGQRQPAGRVTGETVLAGSYRADVVVDRESYLMVKTTYHPNWKATVDGRSAPTVMLSPSFVGVKLPPGQHSVRLDYRPGILRRYLLGLGFLALLTVAALEWRPWQAHRPPGYRQPAPLD
jgi:hypothetical protein